MGVQRPLDGGCVQAPAIHRGWPLAAILAVAGIVLVAGLWLHHAGHDAGLPDILPILPGYVLAHVLNTLSDVDNISDDSSLLLSDPRGIAVFELSGSTYAAVTAYSDEGIQILDITDPYNISPAGGLCNNRRLKPPCKNYNIFQKSRDSHISSSRHTLLTAICAL